MGLFRHADAGYKDAIENSKEWGVKIPMQKIEIYSLYEFFKVRKYW